MHEIEIEFDVPVPMRDGTLLRADVYRPAKEGSFPVLVCRTPYDKGLVLDGLLGFRTFVRAGYILVFQDTRGRFASEGEWTPWKHEREDGYDTIEWAASLPQSNGKVGMFGASYLGSTQWSAAVSGAPHLVSIAPQVTWSDPEDGLMFRGGAIELGLNAWWGPMQALGQFPKEELAPEVAIGKTLKTIGDLDTLATRGYWELPSGALPMIVETGQPDIGVSRALANRETTDDSRVSNRYDEVDIPTLTVAGWYDVFLQGSLDNYIGMRSRGRTARLVVGPWAHMSVALPFHGGQLGDVNFGLSSLAPGGQPVGDIQLEWFDHWLKGEPATAAHESGVLIFVMGIDEWRAEPDWPLARATDTPIYLDEGSSLNWAPSTAEVAESGFVYDPADPVLTRGGNLVMASQFPPGPFDQSGQEERDDVLVFTTEPLDADLEITGRVRAALFASTDGPSTDWVVRLCDVDEHGVSRNIVDGITRIHTEPSRVEEVEIDLWSTSIVIRSGHRLRVQVTSSNFPRWDRNLNTGEPEGTASTMRVAQQRIFHDRGRQSRVILPVVVD